MEVNRVFKAMEKKQTAVEWFEDEFCEIIQLYERDWNTFADLINRAKQIEKDNTDNKVIHFSEWLTKKHPLALIELYKIFEEQYYKNTDDENLV